MKKNGYGCREHWSEYSYKDLRSKKCCKRDVECEHDKKNKNKNKDKYGWYPHPVQDYKNSVNWDASSPDVDIERSRNEFGYSMQQIEFIEQLLQDFYLSNVVKRMFIKTYVLVGTSVIELIIDYLLRQSNHKSTLDEWLKIDKQPLNRKLRKELQVSDIPCEDVRNWFESRKEYKATTKVKIKAEIFEKVPLKYKRMDFQEMIRVAKKIELFGNVNSKLYECINDLRNLRNKIHLPDQPGSKGKNKDYDIFTEEALQTIRSVLYYIVNHPLVKSDVAKKGPDIYNFIYEAFEKPCKNCSNLKECSNRNCGVMKGIIQKT